MPIKDFFFEVNYVLKICKLLHFRYKLLLPLQPIVCLPGFSLSVWQSLEIRWKY